MKKMSLALASIYSPGHEMRGRWSMATVPVFSGALRWTWLEMAPTSKRFVEDAMKIRMVLRKIIEVKGDVVPGEFYRKGWRARRADSNGVWSYSRLPSSARTPS